ncbi:ParB/RepB/Spo0J family partition protein [Virgibacillus necropolis]|uniref:Chromosome partitioning protein ParB n=1 Tax=Virgibacillus necropolis TaxID=163877 RepID=A0A221M9I4_9BACI|nr:ParB N-terminal domain-containing protein [Virgibacillus necropolis]ASN04304.1 chromosome partitioning protein ParB [Virgibacillus necropolis]
MGDQQKKIKLSQIGLETNFRKKEKDLSLELSINRHGLRVPLIVEEESKDHYILVDGYRRFYALEFLGEINAECSIEKLSSEEERIVKRLGIELHTRKRTAYQLERMINRLLETGKYDAKLIASLCNVTERTITKYIRGLDINPDWIRRGEQAGAGRHAFTDIHNLNLTEENKNYIANKYIDRQINKTTVDVLKKATREKAFEEIAEENIKKCIDQVIEKQSKDYETVKEVVNENSLQAGHTKSGHTFMHNLNLNLITRIEKVFKNRYYVNYLSDKQKDQLIKSLRNLILTLKPPIKWSSFPDKDQLRENPEDEFSDRLEH